MKKPTEVIGEPIGLCSHSVYFSNSWAIHIVHSSTLFVNLLGMGKVMHTSGAIPVSSMPVPLTTRRERVVGMANIALQFGSSAAGLTFEKSIHPRVLS